MSTPKQTKIVKEPCQVICLTTYRETRIIRTPEWLLEPEASRANVDKDTIAEKVDYKYALED